MLDETPEARAAISEHDKRAIAEFRDERDFYHALMRHEVTQREAFMDAVPYAGALATADEARAALRGYLEAREARSRQEEHCVKLYESGNFEMDC